MWDAGDTRTAVIEHGIVDPGHRYTGELARRGRGRQRAGAPAPGHRHRPAAGVRPGRPAGRVRHGHRRRWPSTSAPGVHARRRPAPAPACTRELARRRVYLHPSRWTSLGLSLLEAMQLGMPVVALATHRGGRGGAAGGGRVSALTWPGSPGPCGSSSRSRSSPAAGQRRRASSRWRTTGSIASSPTGTGCSTTSEPTTHGGPQGLPRPLGGDGGADQADPDRPDECSPRLGAREPAGRTGRAGRGRAERARARAGHGARRDRSRGDGVDPPGPHRPARRGAAGPGRAGVSADGRPPAAAAEGRAGGVRAGPHRRVAAGLVAGPAGRGARPFLDVRGWPPWPPLATCASRSCRPSTRSARSSGATRVPRTAVRRSGSPPNGRSPAVRTGSSPPAATRSFELARMGVPRGRTAVVPCGVDLDLFSPDGPVARAHGPAPAAVGRSAGAPQGRRRDDPGADRVAGRRAGGGRRDRARRPGHGPAARRWRTPAGWPTGCGSSGR